MQEINYSSLKKNHFEKINVWIAAVACILVAIIFIIIVAYLVSDNLLRYLVLIISIFALAVLLGLKERYYYKGFEKFLLDNNWYPVAESNLIPKTDLLGISSTYCENIAYGKFGNVEFWLNKLSVVEPSTEESTLSLVEIRLRLKRHIDDFIIVPKDISINTKAFIRSVELKNFDDIKLEGSFSDNFILKVKRGQQIEAMSFIAPDVMATIQDFDKGMLVFSTRGVCSIITSSRTDFDYTYDTIKPLFEFSKKIAKELSDKYS